MSNQPRMLKVLLVLIVSMTSGTAILIALGNNAPSSGLFSLAAYQQLEPIESALTSISPQMSNSWKNIEVFYSGTKAGNIPQLASREGLKAEELNCHFCICNGLGGDDGKIEATARWQKQWPCIQSPNWNGSPQTIRICVISDGQSTLPTDFQIKRVITLIDVLCKRFNIQYSPSPQGGQ
jgi:hypothetical protein